MITSEILMTDFEPYFMVCSVDHKVLTLLKLVLITHGNTQLIIKFEYYVTGGKCQRLHFIPIHFVCLGQGRSNHCRASTCQKKLVS